MKGIIVIIFIIIFLILLFQIIYNYKCYKEKVNIKLEISKIQNILNSSKQLNNIYNKEDWENILLQNNIHQNQTVEEQNTNENCPFDNDVKLDPIEEESNITELKKDE